jgi:hypothetical protein
MHLNSALLLLGASLCPVIAQSDAILSAAGAANVSGPSGLVADWQRSLFWNTYRPQLYHGVRARIPHSLMTGLMWFGLNDYTGYNGMYLYE